MSEFKNKLRDLIMEAADAGLSEVMPTYSKKAGVNSAPYYEVEIYADYRDELSEKTAIEILKSEDPDLALVEYLEEVYRESRWEEEDSIVDKVLDYIRSELDIDLDEYETDIRDYVLNQVEILLPIDHYKKQDVYLDIFIDTGDGNYDYVLNHRYPAYGGDDGPIPEEASIVWLARTQGYAEDRLRNALNQGDVHDPSGFLRSMRQEMANLPSHMACLTFLVRMTLGQAIDLNWDMTQNPSGSIILDKETMCGLYDMWSGGGSVLEVELERDVKIPYSIIRSALPDGGDGQYSVGETYGMAASAWQETFKQFCA